DRAVDQLDRELVAVVDRAVPDAAGQPRFVVLLHQLEEVGLLAVLLTAARLRFHRRAARVGLHAAAPAARAFGAAAFDHHVADLPGRAAAEPGLAAEDQAAADAGPPEDADQAVEALAGAERVLGFGRHLDVVADPDFRPQVFFERLAEREGAFPARQVAGGADGSGLLVDVT